MATTNVNKRRSNLERTPVPKYAANIQTAVNQLVLSKNSSSDYAKMLEDSYDLYCKYFSPNSFTYSNYKEDHVYVGATKTFKNFLNEKVNPLLTEKKEKQNDALRVNDRDKKKWEPSGQYYLNSLAALMMVVCTTLIVAAFLPPAYFAIPIIVTVFVGIVVAASAAFLVSLIFPPIYNFFKSIKDNIINEQFQSLRNNLDNDLTKYKEIKKDLEKIIENKSDALPKSESEFEQNNDYNVGLTHREKHHSENEAEKKEIIERSLKLK